MDIGIDWLYLNNNLRTKIACLFNDNLIYNNINKFFYNNSRL